MSVQRRGVDVGTEEGCRCRRYRGVVQIFLLAHVWGGGRWGGGGTILSGPQVTSLDRLRKDVTWSSREAVKVDRLQVRPAGPTDHSRSPLSHSGIQRTQKLRPSVLRTHTELPNFMFCL